MQRSGQLEYEKSGEAVSKCLFYMGYHVIITQCMHPNFFIGWSSAPHAHVQCASGMGLNR